MARLQKKQSRCQRKSNLKNLNKKKKCKGHGKNGTVSYSGAEKIKIPHEWLKPKDRCPVCKKGKVYDVPNPSLIVRISAQAPLSAKVYELQKLRCNLCGQVFTAKAPEGLGDEKYDSASGAMIALLKYGSGLPFNRLDNLQESLGIPLPASTQWEIVQSVADKIQHAYRELIRKAAQGDVIHNDDTVMKILDQINLSDEDKQGRTGMFTSGFMSIAGNTRIVLFLTGHNYADENMVDSLAKRSNTLGPPIQMCDGLSRNIPKNFKTILANCLVHGRSNEKLGIMGSQC